MKNESAITFIGVTHEIENNFTPVSDANEVVSVTKKNISELGKDFEVFPGISVYARDYNYPEEGPMAVAAVIAKNDAVELVDTAKALSAKQKDLIVDIGVYDGTVGDDTKAFKANVNNVPMSKLGQAWQDAAMHEYEEGKNKGTFVYAHMYEKGNGEVVIQAEADPVLNKDMKNWQRAVREVAAAVGREVDKNIEPEFIDAKVVHHKELGAHDSSIDGANITRGKNGVIVSL